MLDIKFIRDNVQVVKDSLKKRGSNFDFDGFLALDEKRREFIKKIDSLKAEQNKLSEQVSLLMRQKKDAKGEIEQSKVLSAQLRALDKDFKEIKDKYDYLLLSIPNVVNSSVPVGGEKCNLHVRSKGELKKFDFKPLTHIELGEKLDILDFKASAKLTGSNFALFKGDGAGLERALINFMLDLHINEHKYKEVSPPFLVNRASMTTTGQLPNLEEDMYRLSEEDYFLIPTAEVPVTNIHRDEVLDESSLPVCYVSYTACFRREAGSYGKDTRGLVRVHQFDKVEMVKFTNPADSYDELERLLENACKVLELLEIPYRVTLLASQEISFAAAKCYDIEIYAPGIDKWLEVASCSNFEDFQARRGNIRYKDKQSGKKEFVHTLNGSGVALARLVVSLLENYQRKDGSIVIPRALRGYMGGKSKIVRGER